MTSHPHGAAIKEEAPLGCCEYRNRNGDVAHVLLTSCCDCEALDGACDRCLRCLPYRPGTLTQVWTSVADRLRVPLPGGAVPLSALLSRGVAGPHGSSGGGGGGPPGSPRRHHHHHVGASRLRAAAKVASAVQVQCDAIAPIFIIPTLLVFATQGEWATLAVCFLTPVALLLLYRCWRESPGRPRTRFFFSWSLVSAFCMAYAFLVGVIFTRLVHLWEGMIVLLGMIFMFYFLFLAKQDPGTLRSHQSLSRGSYGGGPGRRGDKLPGFYEDLPRQGAPEVRDKTFVHYPTSRPPPGGIIDLSGSGSGRTWGKVNGYVGGSGSKFSEESSPMDTPRWGHSEEGAVSEPETVTLPRRARTISENLPEHEVLWVDSRRIRDGVLRTYCEACSVTQPRRASHCHVCNQCIEERDHHCIWIDQCIGKRNHKWFLLALVTMMATAMYALHLSLTTICTPEMVYDWFLYPRDCRFVYSDFIHAVSFVSCCYTMTSLMLLSAVLLQQLVLISQNITLTEFNMAARRRWVTHMGLLADHNDYNHRSFLTNWMAFFRGQRHLTRAEWSGGKGRKMPHR